MSRLWQAFAWTGGAVGAAITGAVVGVAAHSSRIALHRRESRDSDPYHGERLGELKPDRQSTVAADDGVPLSVQEIKPADGGEAELTVVLVHGYSLDCRSWHFQRRDLPLLADPRVRVVQYDQRSHGRSGRSTRENSTIDQLGRDLDAVLRSLAQRGPIVLVAHSMGGMAVMALAERRPELFVDRVIAVALIGTSAGEVASSPINRPWLSKRNPLPKGAAVLAAWQPAVVERARRAGDHVMWSIIRGMGFGNRPVSTSLVDLMVDMIGRTPVGVVTDFLETLGAHDRRTALAALRTCEVLVLSGDADRMTPFSHAELIASELPNAELVRVTGAGHMVMLERPGLVNEHLVALLRRAMRSGGNRRNTKIRRKQA